MSIVMEVTIINGNPGKEDEDFDRYIQSLESLLLSQKYTVHSFLLRDMDIRYCIGCWDCWWKTPGICRHKDDSVDIYRAIVTSDFLIMTSPVIAGFVSSLLKKFNDRMIPLLHPYVKLIQGECHHRKRYAKYPLLGLIVKPEQSQEKEDLEIIEEIYKRFALNFHSDLRFVNTDQDNPENIIRVILESSSVREMDQKEEQPMGLADEPA